MASFRALGDDVPRIVRINGCGHGFSDHEPVTVEHEVCVRYLRKLTSRYEEVP